MPLGRSLKRITFSKMIIIFLIFFLLLLLVLCFVKNNVKCRFSENEVTAIYQSDSTEDVKKKVSYILLFGGWENVNEDVYNIDDESVTQRFYSNGAGCYLNVTLVKDEKFVYVGYAYKNIVSKFNIHDDEFFNLIKSLV